MEALNKFISSLLSPDRCTHVCAFDLRGIVFGTLFPFFTLPLFRSCHCHYGREVRRGQGQGGCELFSGPLCGGCGNGWFGEYFGGCHCHPRRWSRGSLLDLDDGPAGDGDQVLFRKFGGDVPWRRFRREDAGRSYVLYHQRFG